MNKLQDRYRHIPNALTLLRIALVPVFAWFLLSDPTDFRSRIWAAIIFIISAFTDFLDGRIARKYDIVTDFGKLWDPVADKVLTGVAFIGLGIINELYWWMIIVILIREWGITLMRAVMAKYKIIAANKGGKLKTVLQTLALTLFLFNLARLPYWLVIISWVFMWAAFVLTVLTGLEYCYEAIKVRRQFAEKQRK